MENEIRFLKALADETRMNILQLLRQGERCACSIGPIIGKAQSTVSGHLKILENAGIVNSRHVGTNIWYRIDDTRTRKIMNTLGIKPIEKRSGAEG